MTVSEGGWALDLVAVSPLFLSRKPASPKVTIADMAAGKRPYGMSPVNGQILLSQNVYFDNFQ